jgi:hypothetical protein
LLELPELPELPGLPNLKRLVDLQDRDNLAISRGLGYPRGSANLAIVTIQL